MKKLFYGLAAMLFVVGCQHDMVIPENMKTTMQSLECDSDSIYFVNEIQPLLNSSCATSGCHDDQSAEDGVKMTSYENIVITGKVRAFRPEDSKLYKVLSKKGEHLMPPSPQAPFTSEQKDLIKNWIMQGALNKECIADCNPEVLSFSSHITPIINSNCVTCHSGAQPDGGVLLTSYSQVFAQVQSGKLNNVLTASNGAPMMPPSGILSDCSKNNILKWIEDGAPNN
jgi:uncharacterized membrane protein